MTDEKAVRDTIVIRSPSTEEEWEQAGDLLSELKAWDVRQSEALGFDPDEVIGIFYTDAIGDSRRESTPPAGCLLLATDARRPVGLAAYRQLTSNACELYNVYVSPVCRGCGIASRLLRALMSNAKSVGYRTMCLETAMFMHDAHRLYRTLNFQACEPYRRIPAKFAAATMWMECRLVN
jgi:GNAT superfamily N-acetyltransferase